MAAEDIKKYQFRPGQSGNPKGRPKNRVLREWLPACFGKKRTRTLSDLTQEEVSTIERRLLVCTGQELTALVRWEDCPAYAKTLGMAILADLKNGKTTTIDKLRERQYGKPVQKVELTGADGQPLMQPLQEMTQAEAREFLRKLEEEY